MFTKEDFETLRGRFSNAMGALKPNAEMKNISSTFEKFDNVIKPLIGYDEVDVLVRLTFKDLKGSVKKTNYRPIQKDIVIPEDAVYFYATLKIVAKTNEVVLETKEDDPFVKTQAVYVEENLTAKQQATMIAKMKKKESLSIMASMEQIEEYGRNFITFKQTKKLEV